MSMQPGSEHWLDRLAARYTRRQALKGGAIAAAALTLPGVRVAEAAADPDPTACREGCQAFTHIKAFGALTACASQWSTDIYLAGTVLYESMARAMWYEANDTLQRCMDSALIDQAFSQVECFMPNCPDYDPHQPGGPCENCTSFCCVDATAPLGYTCCAVCCSQNGGCGSSVTECGG
jgi:hypothetical protein